MPQPTTSMDLKRIGFAAMLTVGMALSPIAGIVSVPSYAFADVLPSVSGSVSQEVYWYYDSSQKALHLSGKTGGGYYKIDSRYWATTRSHADDNKLLPELIEKIVIDSAIAPVSTADWFNGCEDLKSIEGLNKMDTSKTQDMSRMFYNCKSLGSLDLSSFTTSTSTKMTDMFYGCDELYAVNLGKNFYFNDVALFAPHGSVNWAYVPNKKYVYTEDKLAIVWNEEKKNDAISKFVGWWSREDEVFTIKFNANTGKGIMSDIEDIAYGTSVSLANQFEKDGYDFVGWNTVPTPTDDNPGSYYGEQLSGSSWDKVASDVVNNTLTLHAQWEAESTDITITYNSNLGSGSATKTQSATKKEATTLTKIADLGDAFKRDGFTFAGWNTVANPTTENPGTSYTDGQSVTFEKSTVLYAQWKFEPKTDVKSDSYIKIDSSNIKDIADSLEFTDEEKAAGVLVYLESKYLDQSAVPADVANRLVAAATARGATSGVYFDLSLYKKVGDNAPVKIEGKLSSPLTFTVDVPTNPNLRNTDSKVTRTFYLFHDHDNAATFVPSTEKDNVLTASSDTFSTYLMAYSDKSSSTNNNTNTNTNTNTGGTTTTTTTSTTSRTTPNTGDASFVGAGVMGLAGFIAAGFGAIRRRKN